MSAEPRDEGMARLPGLLNGVLATAILLIVATLAIRANQAPTPAVAEFAPQAQNVIKQAPQEQTSRLGSGSGGAGILPPVSPPASPPPVRGAILNCIGDPPRQIEDPQSPPCVPYWPSSSSNGGATAPGVTATQINVAFGEYRGMDYTGEMQVLQNFFNTRFQFYGRKLNIIPYKSTGTESPSDYQAEAVMVQQQLGAFAALISGDRGGAEDYYDDQLAQRGIVSVAQRGTFAGEPAWSAHSPYEWSYLPGADMSIRLITDFACQTLAGQPAQWAGGVYRGQPRKFGVWTTRTQDGQQPDLNLIGSSLSACGIQVAAWAQTEDPAPSNNAQDYQNQVLKLQNSGVTTVLCICRLAALLFSSAPANSNGYTPEWVISSWQGGDTETTLQTRAPSQNDSTFGLSFWSKRTAMSDLPCEWASKEVDPSFTWASHNTPFETGYDACEYDYSQLLALASGIQMAGPRLNAASFQQGLFQATWPNPNAGAPPWYQAAVTWSPSDHSMNHDAAVIWWNPTRTSYQDGQPGSFCYYRSGERFGLGAWPRGPEALFNPTDCS